MSVLFIFFLFFLIFILLTILFVASPSKCWTDCTAPLNLFIYREPSEKYSDQLVNLWIKKPWKNDGSQIPCRIETYDDDKNDNNVKNLIIYSHGNAENILHCVQFARELALATKSDVLTYDYSGYGLNKIDRFERTEEGINITLKTVLEEMLVRGYRLENILLWGYSLGSGCSTKIASNLSEQGKMLRGLVLFGAYSSILGVVSDTVHEKIAKMFTERWNSEKNIAKVTCPILILHGQSDNMIKLKHANKLKQANPLAKLVIMHNVGHTSFSWSDSIKEVNDWIRFISVSNSSSSSAASDSSL